MMGASLTSHGRRALVDHIAERTGLNFDGCHRKRMTETVEDILGESGAADPTHFLRLLHSDPTQYERLTDRLTVGETYFMREAAHFELLRTTIAPERLDARRGHLCIWSAGCASGEEPYSLAIALDEAGLLGQATIVGSDLTERALDRAREALYSRWSLRRCDAEQRRRWFDIEGSRFRLKSRYRDAVEFRRASVLDPPPVRSVDVALCRNVLIYLTPGAVRTAAATLHDALAPGGWLLTGASDPPLEHPGLVREVSGHGVAYRRLAPTVSRAATIALRGPEPASPAARQPRRRRHDADRPDRAAAAFSLPPSGGTSRPCRAGATSAVAAADTPCEAHARYFAAVEHLAADRPHEAGREARAAVYLDPSTIAAYLLLAQIAQQTGDVKAYLRDHRNALALLLEQPSDAIVPLLDERAGHVVQGVLDRLRKVDASR